MNDELNIYELTELFSTFVVHFQLLESRNQNTLVYMMQAMSLCKNDTCLAFFLC